MNDEPEKYVDPDTGIEITSNGSEAGNDFITGYARIVEKNKEEEAKWIEELKEKGVCAAHPDDGWVDRKNKVVWFVYPQFFEADCGQGDLVALGRPKSYRLVRLAEEVPVPFSPSGRKERRFRYTEEPKE